jgi:hypothetical protein
LNAHKDSYHIQSKKDWVPCTPINYYIDPKGSLEQYKRILLNPAVKIWMYNGDWDDVVPFPDTLKNLNKMSIKPVGVWTPWFTNGGD